MEFNHQTAEKPEHLRWSTDDQAGVGQVRSYTCGFCKRGFSNAQALGGHMNIHRRDRAKLKLSSEENLLSLEISVKNSTDHNESQPPLEEKILLKWDSGEDKNTNNHKKPNIFLDNINDHPPQSGKIVGAAEIQLPFIAGRRTSVMVEKIEEKRKRIMELKHACSSKVEIDLELRLGPQPLQEASTLSTREFF